MNEVRDDKVEVVRSSGNVFADLGLPHDEKEMAKIDMAVAITKAIQKRNLTQVQAAKIIGTDQAKISALLRGRLDDFSIDRLISFLGALGKDVEVKITGNSKSKGKLKVKTA